MISWSYAIFFVHTLTELSLDDGDAENLNSDGAAEGLAFESRTIFIIDPRRRIRLIFNYPAAVGVNTAEVLRTIDCLQTAALAE